MSQEIVLQELSKSDWVNYDTLSKRLNYNIKTLSTIIRRLYRDERIIKEKKVVAQKKNGKPDYRVFVKKAEAE